MKTSELLRQQSQKTIDAAKKANRLAKACSRRLESFPLWKRVILFPKFKRLRETLKRHEANRFFYTSISMHLARSIKLNERLEKKRGK